MTMKKQIVHDKRYWITGLTLISGLILSACSPQSVVKSSPKKLETEQKKENFNQTSRPKLVLVISIDQMRADYLARFDKHLSEDGFKRLLREGASWTGRIGHYATYTGPGHALMLSGSYPYINGISTNRWWNYAKERSEAMVFDPNHKILGQKTKTKHDVSPANFRGSTVGDELHLATGGKSKTVGIGIKGRGAILMGGPLAQAYWMNTKNGEMTTSTYYADELPQWLQDFNQKKIPERYFGKTWDYLYEPEAYASVVADDAIAELGPWGIGTTFIHMVNGGLNTIGPDYYQAFIRSPYAHDHQFALAKAAIEGEQLGKRGVTDMLTMSISATDLVGHYLGPFSHEMVDLIYRFDDQLGGFFDWLDAEFGKDQVMVVVTSDHGATPVPEQLAAKGIHSGRIKKKTIETAIDSVLDAEFGAGDWVARLEDPHIFLNRDLIKKKALDIEQVRKVAGEALFTIEGFGGYFTREQLLTGQVPDTMIGRSMLKTYYAPRGGDVVAWVLPLYFWGKYGEKHGGSTHGTIYHYDSEVPVFMMGKHIAQGRYGSRDQADLAATLSHLLGIPKPAGCEGDIVPIIAD